MAAPEGPHIKTTYRADGTMVQEPRGFGGETCKHATQPYLRRQGFNVSRATAEADLPSYLATERQAEAIKTT